MKKIYDLIVKKRFDLEINSELKSYLGADFNQFEEWLSDPKNYESSLIRLINRYIKELADEKNEPNFEKNVVEAVINHISSDYCEAQGWYNYPDEGHITVNITSESTARKNTTFRLGDKSRSAIARLAAERGISQGELIESLIQKEEGTQDVYPVLEHCLNTLSNAEQELENWYYDQDEPDNIQKIKDRLALCQNILIDTPEVKYDDRSNVEIPELDDGPTSKFAFSAWSKKFEAIINALKK